MITSKKDNEQFIQGFIELEHGGRLGSRPQLGQSLSVELGGNTFKISPNDVEIFAVNAGETLELERPGKKPVCTKFQEGTLVIFLRPTGPAWNVLSEAIRRQRVGLSFSLSGNRLESLSFVNNPAEGWELRVLD